MFVVVWFLKFPFWEDLWSHWLYRPTMKYYYHNYTKGTLKILGSCSSAKGLLHNPKKQDGVIFESASLNFKTCVCQLILYWVGRECGWECVWFTKGFPWTKTYIVKLCNVLKQVLNSCNSSLGPHCVLIILAAAELYSTRCVGLAWRREACGLWTHCVVTDNNYIGSWPCLSVGKSKQEGGSELVLLEQLVGSIIWAPLGHRESKRRSGVDGFL